MGSMWTAPPAGVQCTAFTAELAVSHFMVWNEIGPFTYIMVVITMKNITTICLAHSMCQYILYSIEYILNLIFTRHLLSNEETEAQLLVQR